MWTELLYLLITTHLTIASVTLYLHRSQTHRGVEFHPILNHCMRFWLWLTTGMRTQVWVAIHRRHHQLADQPGDPHSPHQFGLLRVVTSGWRLYRDAARDQALVEQYGRGTPQDWIEQRLYTPLDWTGLSLLLLINTLLFGGWGLLIWGIQLIWIPFFAAGVINGIGHWWGYRNGETRDQSRNISPIGILIGGEELHNSHHLEPANPKFSRHWWEFDIGWMYIRILCRFRLARITQNDHPTASSQV